MMKISDDEKSMTQLSMSSTVAASRLANPFAGDVPTHVDTRLECLDSGEYSTIAFNKRGTYLAAGSSLGMLVIYDLETLSPALTVKALHSDDISSVSFVNGRLVCTTSVDGTLKLFDIESRKVVFSMQFGVEVVGASLHPHRMDRALVCLGIEDVDDAQPPWPRLYALDPEVKSKPQPLVQYVIPDLDKNQIAKCLGIAATFSKHGKLVFVGGVSSSIHTFATDTGQHLRVVQPENPRGGPGPKGWLIALSLSRNGRTLLSDAGGRYISVYEVASDALFDNHDSLPSECSLESIQDAMRWRAGKIVTFRKNLQDVVNPTKWSDMCCSGHAEFVLGASSSKDNHELFVWNVTGQLVHILKDPQGGYGVLRRALWHPWRAQVATLTGEGNICLWGSKATAEDKSWLAFAPGFVEIEENIVVADQNPEVAAAASAAAALKNGGGDAIMNGEHHTQRPPALSGIEKDVEVDVIRPEAFVEMFSDDENSNQDEQSIRSTPRCITKGIGYFISATADDDNYVVTLNPNQQPQQ